MVPRRLDAGGGGGGLVRLTDAWCLGPSEVVALVGGGGKTSLMEALAADYEAEGARVVLTTTTKVRPPVPGGRPLVLADSIERLRGLMGSIVDRRGGLSPVVGVRVSAEGKVEGIPSEWVPVLRDMPGVDAVLVEADGSAGRSLKAPAAWEPVIPGCTSLVVAVAGLDAQGQPLDEAHVHRPELVAELLGVPLGTRLAPHAVLETVVRGYGPRVPPGAVLKVFLNKLDAVSLTPELEEACAVGPVEVWAGAAGAHVSGGPAMLRAVRRPAQAPACVVLAAGLARRMGGVKLLAPLGDGTVFGRVVAAVSACRERLSHVVVVAGRGGEDVSAAADAFEVVVNPDPAGGQAGSLRLGVGALGGRADILVVLGDQPFVTAGTLDRVLDARAAAPRAAAVGLSAEPVSGATGASVRPPVVVHRSLVPQMLTLEGDVGARELLARYRRQAVAVLATPEEMLDVDTPDALELARGLVGEDPSA